MRNHRVLHHNIKVFVRKYVLMFYQHLGTNGG